MTNNYSKLIFLKILKTMGLENYVGIDYKHV